VHIADDVICYLRETEKDRILVAVSRNTVDNVTIDLKRASVESLENLLGSAKLSIDGSLSIAGAGFGIWRVK
jgi:hypothetical protein